MRVTCDTAMQLYSHVWNAFTSEKDTAIHARGFSGNDNAAHSRRSAASASLGRQRKVLRCSSIPMRPRFEIASDKASTSVKIVGLAEKRRTKARTALRISVQTSSMATVRVKREEKNRQAGHERAGRRRRVHVQPSVHSTNPKQCCRMSPAMLRFEVISY